ncbi:site-specific DNA-methyltransferase [Microcoleus sp. FACHB-1515]|uniref:DNA methyltransferase n=1 Tax=Cyanophyceae TaxID=3028117 RepID=UPI001689478A|nr:site-specific DNA-methyltransferase [Microcoleus sp. FACHB-1515]MBD2089307.1 site-specific DNA-methyltransferase [Microcoleus sp. FACHB-1515]
MTHEESEPPKALAPRNRTVQLSETERQHYRSRLLHLDRPAEVEELLDRTICQDLFTVLDQLPTNFVDLLFLDPPYNLNKLFHQQQVKRRSLSDYADWLDSWLSRLLPCLKPTASIYLCGDWQSSPALYEVASRYFFVRNRITWEREKGRGARSNWKNCSEDIWFCTVSQEYDFDAEAVRLCRRVRAPYTDAAGEPKDWQRSDRGNFRLTAASNLWTDLTVPFWSMPENTNHPTQKPEKLLAKIILASCPIAGVVLDPFLGSGTTSVVAKKLDRHFVGIEIEEYYACLAEKRLEIAVDHRQIQGWRDRVFWERNSHP